MLRDAGEEHKGASRSSGGGPRGGAGVGALPPLASVCLAYVA